MSLLSRTLLHQAAVRPAATALIGRTTRLSYAGLEARVAALSALLRAARIRRLAIMADNSPDWIIADLAAAQAGITTVPVPLFFTDTQVSHLLADAGIDAVLTDQPARLLDGGLGFEPRPFSGTDLQLLQRSIRRDTSLANRTGVAKVTYTSGSTGEPRGVCLGLAGMEAVARSLASRLCDSGVSRHLCVMPLATLLENIAGVYVPLLLGATIHAVPLAQVGIRGSSGLDIGSLRLAIDKSGAQSVILLPQMLNALNRSIADKRWDRCPLRFAAVGGGRVSPAELAAAHRHGLPAYEGYGLSECHSVVALNSPDACLDGSVGRPLPHTQVRIADDGEIMVAGSVMQGYLGDDARTPLEIGTGDLGYLDDEGYLHVHGRKKNLFITGFGRNVSPEWIESELVHEPAIGQVLVWGEAMPRNGALIVPAHGGIGGAEIQRAIEAANQRLPDYARVSVWTTADAPFGVPTGELTPNGRLRRDRILDRYASRLTELINSVETPVKETMNA